MNNLKRHITLSFFACCLILAGFTGIHAQDREGAAIPEVANTSTVAKSISVNHEVRLYVLVASNKPDGKSTLPRALDGVTGQLKASLPFSDYRLTTTFLNRVRDNGTLQVKGVLGGSPFAASQSVVPTFYDFTLANIKLVTDAAGQQFVQIARFRFGQRVPVQSSASHNESGANFPVYQYEETGITTELNLREAVPTLIGVTPTGQPDESFVLILSVGRIGAR